MTTGEVEVFLEREAHTSWWDAFYIHEMLLHSQSTIMIPSALPYLLMLLKYWTLLLVGGNKWEVLVKPFEPEGCISKCLDIKNEQCDSIVTLAKQPHNTKYIVHLKSKTKHLLNLSQTVASNNKYKWMVNANSAYTSKEISIRQSVAL